MGGAVGRLWERMQNRGSKQGIVGAMVTWGEAAGDCGGTVMSGGGGAWNCGENRELWGLPLIGQENEELQEKQ